MIKIEEFIQILKTRKFKSEVKGSAESYIFRFDETNVYRDGEQLGIYHIIQNNSSFSFKFNFSNPNISKAKFKNVTVVVYGDARFPVVVNSEYISLQNDNGFDVTLIAQ